MIIAGLIYDYMTAVKGWTGVFKHKAPENQDTICIYGTNSTSRQTGNFGMANFLEETIEVEICRQKIQGSDASAIEFVRQKIYDDICRAPVTDKIIKITRDRESDLQEGPEKGRYYYSIWFVVTVLL